MHIGYITPEYPTSEYNGNIGGIATFIKNIALQLIANGHQVTIFVHSQSLFKVFEEDGVTIHFIKTKKIKGFTWWSNRRDAKFYINKTVAKKHIDVLEAPEWTGFTAFMKFTCPLIIRLHGSDTYFCHLEKRKVKFKNKFFERWALKGADAIVGVSNFVSNQTKELFGIKKEIKTIYNTINTVDFLPNHNNVKPKTILYFGSIIRKKGVFEIANMFNEVHKNTPHVKLSFLGRDTTDVYTGNSTLEMFKKSLSTKALQRFTHLDAVPYEKVKELIQQSEIIVLPSLAEAFPMTWLEAMALEKKLITSNIGWAKELMIDGKTGFTVSPSNHTDFANKLMRLLNEVELGNTFGKAARKRIQETFNFEKILVENIKFYKKVIDEI